MKVKLAVGTLGVALIVVGVATGCSTHQDSPTPPAQNIRDGQNTQVLNMPDGFRNVAYACDVYGNLVYVTSAKADDTLPSGVFVIPNAPQCTRTAR